MAPKRSDDHAAREREENAPSASEYWGEERRRAARPAGIRRDPASEQTNSAETRNECDAHAESPETSSGNGDTEPEELL